MVECLSRRLIPAEEITMSTVFSTVTTWWHNWRTARATLASLDRCGDDPEWIAHDLGIAATELRALAGRWPDSAGLLNCRLAALDLTGAEIQRTEPQVLSDLQRVCTICKSRRRCKHDLAENPCNQVWREYCPNVVTLDALIDEGVRWTRRAEAA
jgi:hypothetical protein